MFFLLSVCGVMVSCCMEPYDAEGCTASELVEAFVTADLGRAKAVTVPEQWGRLEEAMRGRQPFWCRSSRWGDLEMTGTSGVGRRISQDEWVFGATYRCTSQETPYCLGIADIRVVRTKDGWKVSDWGRMYEAHDYLECE